MAYIRDLNLRNILVHFNDDSSTEQYGSRACQRPRLPILAITSALTPRYEAPATLFLSVAISPASAVILCTAYPVTNALLFFTLVKPGGASGVVVANSYVVSATTLLGPLCSNISTSRVTVLQISGVRSMQLCNGTNLQASASSVK